MPIEESELYKRISTSLEREIRAALMDTEYRLARPDQARSVLPQSQSHSILEQPQPHSVLQQPQQRSALHHPQPHHSEHHVHFQSDRQPRTKPLDREWLIRNSPTPPLMPHLDLSSSDDYELVESVNGRSEFLGLMQTTPHQSNMAQRSRTPFFSPSYTTCVRS